MAEQLGWAFIGIGLTATGLLAAGIIYLYATTTRRRP